jgi:hypothetical protein
MHATLPKVLLADEIKKRIEDMDDGEEGAAAPYAMAADSKDHVWLDPGALVTINKNGNFVVKKTEDGYEVNVNVGVSYRWERGETDTNQLERHTVPVVKINLIGDVPLSRQQTSDMKKLSGL